MSTFDVRRIIEDFHALQCEADALQALIVERQKRLNDLTAGIDATGHRWAAAVKGAAEANAQTAEARQAAVTLGSVIATRETRLREVEKAIVAAEEKLSTLSL